ncbi:MAG: 2Fe-2S iron-sulfur cluster-binding protein, partial [Lysobacterales bacterium]
MSKHMLDLGTPPPRPDGPLLDLEIDGQRLQAPQGTSVMRAAALAGINIPKLCATDSLEPFGSCRLCLVEIEGRKGTPAACTTPVEAGMVVRTQSGQIDELRRNILELYLSDHPLACADCGSDCDCELQELALEMGV